ncbi:retinitis pigmentosa 9 protein homolog [Paramacrobiotus metropolitanus]|uniref:retinitis pigmentosa 9 protein homolog n=1 Tax=Paramacrobiotus metropolitanus TaxID=2943436 RepID=UPI00244570B1|nr:retinitis pigmentosa 9 protein homolog [Paramacrobiotus metropolitanus]
MHRSKREDESRSRSADDRDGESSRKAGKSSSSSIDQSLVAALKHIDTFYEAPPPGFIREDEERPEDCIPDLPQNQAAREFLASAPSKGLWMPLGKEVKVMQCWKCKNYGHRSGDKECPLFYSGNRNIEKFRYSHEDPMHEFMMERKKEQKEERIKQLQALLNSESSDNESTKQDKKRKKKKKDKKKSKRCESESDRRSGRSDRKDHKHKKRRSRSRS